MGPWDEVQVDPRVWGFGKVGLLAYTVKVATQRLVQAQCRDVKGWVEKKKKGWVPGYGVRPRLWRAEDGSLSPATALEQLTSRQKRTFVQMMQQGFSSGSRQGRFGAANVAAGVHANWMDPSPPRQHPRPSKRLTRPLRVFGYKLLHAALGVGGARVYAARNMQQLLDCCCK
jgi:hypothetical protein